MTLSGLAVLFVMAVLAHNLEEAIWLPAWSQRHSRWHQAVSAGEFRFGVGLLSALLIGVAILAFATGPGSVAAYIFFGYVFAMAANAIVPHLLATLLLRTYMPGTATGVLFNLPLAA